MTTIELTQEDRSVLRDAAAIVCGTVSFPLKRLWQVTDGLRDLAWRGCERTERSDQLPDQVGVVGDEVALQERML